MSEIKTPSGAGPPGPPGNEKPVFSIRTFTCRSLHAVPSVKGFSLIELLAVIAVIAVVLAVVFPRLPGLEGYNLDSDSARLSQLSGFLGERAASKRSYYRLWFDFNAGEVRVESSADGKKYAPEPESALRKIKFGPSVLMEEVRSPGLGVVTRGESAIVFSPYGSEPFDVRLAAAGRSVIVSFNPYTGKAKVRAPEDGEKAGQPG
jgi:prepilin-type N-terminal cleavage/methylation domain-containing protein